MADNGCPGKQSWPDLKGGHAWVAKTRIEEENPNVHAIIVEEGTAVTRDFRCDRIHLDHNKLVSEPAILRPMEKETQATKPIWPEMTALRTQLETLVAAIDRASIDSRSAVAEAQIEVNGDGDAIRFGRRPVTGDDRGGTEFVVDNTSSANYFTKQMSAAEFQRRREGLWPVERGAGKNQKFEEHHQTGNNRGDAVVHFGRWPNSNDETGAATHGGVSIHGGQWLDNSTGGVGHTRRSDFQDENPMGYDYRSDFRDPPAMGDGLGHKYCESGVSPVSMDWCSNGPRYGGLTTEFRRNFPVAEDHRGGPISFESQTPDWYFPVNPQVACEQRSVYETMEIHCGIPMEERSTGPGAKEFYAEDSRAAIHDGWGVDTYDGSGRAVVPEFWYYNAISGERPARRSDWEDKKPADHGYYYSEDSPVLWEESLGYEIPNDEQPSQCSIAEQQAYLGVPMAELKQAYGASAVDSRLDTFEHQPVLGSELVNVTRKFPAEQRQEEMLGSGTSLRLQIPMEVPPTSYGDFTKNVAENDPWGNLETKLVKLISSFLQSEDMMEDEQQKELSDSPVKQRTESYSSLEEERQPVDKLDRSAPIQQDNTALQLLQSQTILRVGSDDERIQIECPAISIDKAQAPVSVIHASGNRVSISLDEREFDSPKVLFCDGDSVKISEHGATYDPGIVDEFSSLFDENVEHLNDPHISRVNDNRVSMCGESVINIEALDNEVLGLCEFHETKLLQNGITAEGLNGECVDPLRCYDPGGIVENVSVLFDDEMEFLNDVCISVSPDNGIVVTYVEPGIRMVSGNILSPVSSLEFNSMKEKCIIVDYVGNEDVAYGYKDLRFTENDKFVESIRCYDPGISASFNGSLEVFKLENGAESYSFSGGFGTAGGTLRCMEWFSIVSQANSLNIGAQRLLGTSERVLKAEANLIIYSCRGNLFGEPLEKDSKWDMKDAEADGTKVEDQFRKYYSANHKPQQNSDYPMAANMAVSEQACDFYLCNATQLSGISLRRFGRGRKMFLLFRWISWRACLHSQKIEPKRQGSSEALMKDSFAFLDDFLELKFYRGKECSMVYLHSASWNIGSTKIYSPGYVVWDIEAEEGELKDLITAFSSFKIAVFSREENSESELKIESVFELGKYTRRLHIGNTKGERVPTVQEISGGVEDWLGRILISAAILSRYIFTVACFGGIEYKNWVPRKSEQGFQYMIAWECFWEFRLQKVTFIFKILGSCKWGCSIIWTLLHAALFKQMVHIKEMEFGLCILQLYWSKSVNILMLVRSDDGRKVAAHSRICLRTFKLEDKLVVKEKGVLQTGINPRARWSIYFAILEKFLGSFLLSTDGTVPPINGIILVSKDLPSGFYSHFH